MEISHSEAIIKHLRGMANAQGAVSYEDFSRAALFLPEHGYYAQANRARVGKSADTDFYTASTLKGGVFAQLVLACFETLLGRDFCEQATLVEIGAEPGRGLFDADKGPFKDTLCLRLGQPLEIPKKAAVFANEWLDAQPFRSFRNTPQGWREIGVRVNGDILEECLLETSVPLFIIEQRDVPEGYRLDISLEAPKTLSAVCAQNWEGAFITADYGKFFGELIESFPEGTARAYRHHTVSGDLLRNIGDSDLTCDVCWDDLEGVLKAHKFTQVNTLRQEAFFMKNALKPVGEIIQNTDPADPEKRALMEILHPGQMGARFQILSGVRGKY